jgi:hypothetical protein
MRELVSRPDFQIAIGLISGIVLTHVIYQRRKSPRIDPLVELGLPSQISCRERFNGDGTVDIVIDAKRMPAPGSKNGTTTRISAVLSADGDISGTVDHDDLSGWQQDESADQPQLRAMFEACRLALQQVPGIVG